LAISTSAGYCGWSSNWYRVAAAAALHQLVRDAGQVNADAAAEHDVGVLERDGRDMRAVQPGQRLLGWGQLRGVADPPQVGGQVQLPGSPFVELVGGHRLSLPRPAYRDQSAGLSQ
jgi:hypothetical protein